MGQHLHTLLAAAATDLRRRALGSYTRWGFGHVSHFAVMS
jgi:hypothetical protein